MKYFRNIVVYFVCFLGGFDCVRNERFNYSLADLYCKDNGGLYEHNKVINNGFVILNESYSDNGLLNEGESAWISGYVKYSSFVSWSGCYEENLRSRDIYKYQFDESKITNCVTNCSNHMYDKYIGIHKTVCYCLDSKHMNTEIKTIDDVNCTPQKPYNIYFNNTGSTNKAIHVYRVSTKLSFDQANSLRQCVKAKDVSNKLVYETSSCYDGTDLASGIICINAATGKLDDNNCSNYFQTSDKSPAFCLENKKTSWIGAYERCKDLSGKMLDDNIFSNIKERTQLLKDKYWMGFYRSFEVVTDERQNTCLAVTKNKERLILDPDDCSVKKKVICNLSLQPRSTTTVKMSKSSNENQIRNIIHYVIFVAAVILIVTVGFVIFLIVKKVKKTQNHLQMRQSTNTTDNIEATISFQTFARNGCIDVTSQSFEMKVTKASSANTKCPAGIMDEDYDRIDSIRISTKSFRNQGNDDESHVYDHTPLSEDYNTLRSTFKPTKSVSCSDGVTYSIIKRHSGTTDDKIEKI